MKRTAKAKRRTAKAKQLKKILAEATPIVFDEATYYSLAKELGYDVDVPPAKHLH